MSPTPSISELIGLRVSEIICISNKFLGADEVAGLGYTLGAPLRSLKNIKNKCDTVKFTLKETWCMT